MNPQPLFPLRPVRWSVAAVALALMTSLALSAVIQGTSELEITYQNILSTQQASAMATVKRQNTDTPAVQHQAPQETNRIIVKFKEDNLPPGLSIAAEKANLEKAQGLVKVLTINGINADVYEVSDDDTAREVVDRILASKRDLVEYAEVDMKVFPAYTPNDPNLGSAWHITKVQAPLAWDSAQGEGIIVAIADTGVNCAHPDLAASCVPGWNVFANNNDTRDTGGHGTAVAGTAAEIGDNAIGSAGIAYKAKIMPIQITNGLETWAYYSDMAEAITHAADNSARVVNVSYQGTCGSLTVINAANYMRSKGGVATLSAGNSGAQSTFSPNSAVTCVSATDSGDKITTWSTYGDAVDVSSPGYVFTTNRGGSYGNWYGTSFSAPLTAGIYALMFSANPALTPSQADNILFTTADDLGTPGWDMYYGHGRVNAAKAVAAAKAAIGTRDTVAPSVPQNLRATSITANSITLAWNASTDDNSGVAGYDIYRNGTKLTTVTGTTYTNSGLTSLTSYTYTVRAVDGEGNVSSDSTPLTVSTADVTFGISSYSVAKTSTTATVDTTLTKPGTVTVRYGTDAANLNQTAQSSTQSTTHSVALTGLTANTTYYYQITATDGTNTVTSAVSNFKTSKASGGGGGKPRR